ncbi:MAG: hypothetical protein Q7R35_02005, partial [Elusimicrobiota bacterium]|nr:hypothetical protein [Elusimicrobiota bacterium]
MKIFKGFFRKKILLPAFAVAAFAAQAGAQQLYVSKVSAWYRSGGSGYCSDIVFDLHVDVAGPINAPFAGTAYGSVVHYVNGGVNGRTEDNLAVNLTYTGILAGRLTQTNDENLTSPFDGYVSGVQSANTVIIDDNNGNTSGNVTCTPDGSTPKIYVWAPYGPIGSAVSIPVAQPVTLRNNCRATPENVTVNMSGTFGGSYTGTVTGTTRYWAWNGVGSGPLGSDWDAPVDLVDSGVFSVDHNNAVSGVWAGNYNSDTNKTTVSGSLDDTIANGTATGTPTVYYQKAITCNAAALDYGDFGGLGDWGPFTVVSPGKTGITKDLAPYLYSFNANCPNNDGYRWTGAVNGSDAYLWMGGNGLLSGTMSGVASGGITGYVWESSTTPNTVSGTFSTTLLGTVAGTDNTGVQQVSFYTGLSGEPASDSALIEFERKRATYPGSCLALCASVVCVSTAGHFGVDDLTFDIFRFAAGANPLDTASTPPIKTITLSNIGLCLSDDNNLYRIGTYCSAWDGLHNLNGLFGKINGQFGFRAKVKTNQVSATAGNIIIEQTVAYPSENQLPIKIDLVNVHSVRSSPTVVGRITGVAAQPYNILYRLSKGAATTVKIFEDQDVGFAGTAVPVRSIVNNVPRVGEGIPDGTLTNGDSWDGRDTAGSL